MKVRTRKRHKGEPSPGAIMARKRLAAKARASGVSDNSEAQEFADRPEDPERLARRAAWHAEREREEKAHAVLVANLRRHAAQIVAERPIRARLEAIAEKIATRSEVDRLRGLVGVFASGVADEDVVDLGTPDEQLPPARLAVRRRVLDAFMGRLGLAKAEGRDDVLTANAALDDVLVELGAAPEPAATTFETVPAVVANCPGDTPLSPPAPAAMTLADWLQVAEAFGRALAGNRPPLQLRLETGPDGTKRIVQEQSQGSESTPPIRVGDTGGG